ncbi:MAG: CpsD/CapB family tyrosine-protein kinase [Clostridia bacterium]
MNIFGKGRNKRESNSEKREKIIGGGAVNNFAVREAYNTLRTNIMFSIPKKDCRRFVITSAAAGEGKSTNSVNLAITIAESGSRVLLIDCDLRRPNAANLLNVKTRKGLSNVLVGYNTLEEVLVKDVRKNLDLIPAGEIPPNPTELLGSVEFENILNELSKQYEFIIMDASPMSVVTDAALLSKLADGVAIVVCCDKTNYDQVTFTVNSLNLVGAKIIGFILNGVDTERRFGSRRGKYGDYGVYETERD